MELGTFGAIMGFAVQMLQQTETFYNVMMQKTRDPVLREAFEILSKEEGKTRSLIERTRRENVTEMILEPITGLDQDDYEIKMEAIDQSRDADLLKTALILEERAQRYFSDVSGKVPLPEVGRIFRKVAQKKEKSLANLKNISLNE